MVQLGADETGQAGKRNQGFGFAGMFVCDSAAGQVSAQDEICGEHCAGDHQAESGNRKAAEMQERDHRKQYSVNEWREQEGRAAGNL